MSRELYNYVFASNAFDEVKKFDSKEEAIEFFNEIRANKFYSDAEILEGKEMYVNFRELTRWCEPAWKVCYNKVSLMKRLAMAINA